ncbi:hypothetical protein Micbo1qcDRAFT_153914 [Microdochium bolleyi]|uniref:ChrR-like cupin domain-containing protein n=1 Tax=Microdochium bolleyi TaxID=196109 RepID=A0A136IL65_9PEZI|nr:hypothetical protein Micbo1qcDRAFT_153914 [Microdochium bolleyi]
MSPAAIDDLTQAASALKIAQAKAAEAVKAGTLRDGSILNEKEKAELEFTDKKSSPDVYINGDKDTLWHPWVGTLELRPLRFETRSGIFVIGLRTPVDAWLGKHRHRGVVTAVTISGNWGYSEYDWIAKPGDYVVENPGTIHTLFMGAGSEVVFTLNGSLEFLNDDDSLRETMDIFSFAKMYYDHCKEKGIEPNEKLWY